MGSQAQDFSDICQILYQAKPRRAVLVIHLNLSWKGWEYVDVRDARFGEASTVNHMAISHSRVSSVCGESSNT